MPFYKHIFIEFVNAEQPKILSAKLHFLIYSL